MTKAQIVKELEDIIIPDGIEEDRGIDQCEKLIKMMADFWDSSTLEDFLNHVKEEYE